MLLSALLVCLGLLRVLGSPKYSPNFDHRLYLSKYPADKDDAPDMFTIQLLLKGRFGELLANL